ncbi:MAG: cbb3-type cytochrome c oxidase subunit I, partial [Phycisphaerales bacterium]
MTDNGYNYLSYDRGILSWLFTLDHKRVGVMYLVSITGAFLLGGLLALMVQTELIGPGRTMMGAETFNRAFTLHGMIMVFLVLVPSIPAALGNFLLPVMLGVDRLALPRLNLLSFHLWLLGVLLVIMSAFAGGLDTGWTFSVPYALSDGRLGVNWMAVGVVVLCVATMLTALNFIITIHQLRPAGMTWSRLPLFLWSMYCTAVVHLIAAPFLAAAFALLFAERVWQRGVIDPALGGDPLLFTRLLWFALHPLIWVLILPAIGIVSEVISVHSRRPIVGYRWLAYSGVAIAVCSFLGGGQHLIAGGQPAVFSAATSGLTLVMFIPVSIIVL